MAYKVFTNGSVLNASEINDNLMNQSVMVFSNSTARAAALTAPLEGMITYLEDTAVYESYDGAAWVALVGSGAGLELIKTQTIGTTVSTVTVTDAFSATYDAYKIIVTGGSNTTNIDLRLQLGSATNGHNFAMISGPFGGGSASVTAGSNAAAFSQVGHCDTAGIRVNLELTNPFLALRTGVFGQGTTNTGDGGILSAIQTGSTSFTSFRLFPGSGTMTGGTIAVYGYKKA